MKRYRKYYTEGLRLSDLSKGAGMSDFTKDFRKDRSKEMGTENKTSKLIDAELDSKNVTFVFLTEVTPNYPKNYEWSETEPENNYKMKKNSSKLYEERIRVLDFFELLNTTPENITNKDIEDVLNVADVQVNCTCPSFQYQGMNVTISGFDGSIYPTDIPMTAGPRGWKDRQKNDNFLCKHLGGLVNSYKFFIPQMRQKIKKKLDLTKR